MKTIKKALVTGGAGFIGSHLVDELLRNGSEVVVLDNLSTGHRHNLRQVWSKITFIEGDICDQETLAKATLGCDVIFHQAAVVSVPQTVEDPITSASVNITGTLNVLDAARILGVRRVVLASSCAVYGDNPVQPKDETSPLEPKSPYALQKRVGELHAKLYFELYGLQPVCLRYFNVFGPRQDPSSPYSGVISIFMDRAVQNQAPIIYGDGKQSRDFIYVHDVVAANLKAAIADGVGGASFNVGTGNSITINALWQLVGNLSGKTLTPVYEASRKGDIETSLADVRRAARAIDFKSKFTFEEGLEETFKWYQK